MQNATVGSTDICLLLYLACGQDGVEVMSVEDTVYPMRLTHAMIDCHV
jgi:hypothetical protein